MNTKLALIALLVAVIPESAELGARGIYRKGWIDFNKNGRMDVYENPAAPVEERVADLLSQMTIEEKTCQMATLYGSGRVLDTSYLRRQVTMPAPVARRDNRQSSCSGLSGTTIVESDTGITGHVAKAA